MFCLGMRPPSPWARTPPPSRSKDWRNALGLNKPVIQRYADWAGGMVSGYFGNSTIAVAEGSSDPSVSGIIGTPLRNSLILAAITAMLLIPFSLLLGAYAAVRATKVADHAISTTSLTFSAMPEFVVGSLLIVIFFSFAWSPTSALAGTARRYPILQSQGLDPSGLDAAISQFGVYDATSPRHHDRHFASGLRGNGTSERL